MMVFGYVSAVQMCLCYVLFLLQQSRLETTIANKNELYLSQLRLQRFVTEKEMPRLDLVSDVPLDNWSVQQLEEALNIKIVFLSKSDSQNIDDVLRCYTHR